MRGAAPGGKAFGQQPGHRVILAEGNQRRAVQRGGAVVGCAVARRCQQAKRLPGERNLLQRILRRQHRAKPQVEPAVPQAGGNPVGGHFIRIDCAPFAAAGQKVVQQGGHRALGQGGGVSQAHFGPVPLRKLPHMGCRHLGLVQQGARILQQQPPGFGQPGAAAVGVLPQKQSNAELFAQLVQRHAQAGLGDVQLLRRFCKKGAQAHTLAKPSSFSNERSGGDWK